MRRKFWVRNLCFYAKIFIWKFNLFDLAFTCPPPKVNYDDVIGSNDHHFRYLRIKWPRKYVRHDMFVILIFQWTFGTWPLHWPFQVWPLYSRSTLFRHLPAFFCEFEPFAVRLTDPTAPNMKTVFFDLPWSWYYTWPLS